MSDKTNIEKQISELREKIEYHSRKYYVEDSPEISDYEYDKMFYTLVRLEEENPEFADVNSPTRRVGGKALDKFEKITHTYPLKSLSDVFSYEELGDFVRKIKADYPDAEFSVECKIDGLSVAIHYENGELVYKLPTINEIRKHCQEEIEGMWDEVRRFTNPHNYYVDLSQKLWDIKHKLLKEKGNI